MNNRCPHFDEGILPMRRKTYICNVVVKSSVIIAISLLILPRTSVAVATKYETAYACEGKTLTIECEPGDLINLIRANYGRFSITICNDHGNVDWSVNCMSQQSLNVLHSKCAHKQTCSVLASTNMFGDPCPGTHKYLEAHYTCISAAQTSTMTNRQTPPWQITNHPNVMWSTTPSTLLKSQIQTTVSTISPKTILRTSTTLSSSFSSSSGPVVAVTSTSSSPSSTLSAAVIKSTTARIGVIHEMIIPPLIGDKQKPSSTNTDNPVTTSTIVGSISYKNDENLLVNSNSNDNNPHGNQQLSTTQSTVLVNNNFDGSDNNNYYCEPKQARNLFWNITRVGEVNVQPCPGGATGIAKWRCVFIQRQNSDSSNTISSTSGSTDSGADSIRSNNRDCDQINNNNINNNKCDKNKKLNNNNNLYPTWHPVTPDLTQCRSLWLNNLEIRVNQRDSSLISIANDLSQVTSSKTLYGGDMLVTTKIIQTMSEKMSYDIETFPDQRQREAIIYELLHGVVKTGSNLLDISQQLSWLDLSFEDQMRVATSLLTGLEDNAFLLADTIIRERNVIQKVKNILLSVRVLETRNIVSNEVFPDAKLEQWQVSDDKIELPRGALIENSEGGLVRIVFVAFDRLEAILKPSYDNLDVKFSTNYLQNSIYNQTNAAQHRLRVLNSKVISASLGKGRHIQLSQPIRLVLRHLKTENVTNPTCVFWNYIDHAWSEDGCYLESTNKTHTVCMCNHLTNFAILMDIIDEHNSSLLSMFDSNMRILIYISIAICLLFILIAILTLKLFNGIFVKSTRTSIYKNIYVCLFIIEVLFLLGIEQSEVSLLCGFTTAFLHCFVLSAIAWLFFEGFQLYATLTTDDMLLEVENSSKIIWYYLLSYGLSFTIVAISLAVNPSTYTQSDFCVLMEANGLFYTTFLVPIGLFVVGTIGYPLLACHIMCKKSKTTLKNKEHTRLTSVKFDLRCSFLFLIILSIDWIFAYLYLRKVKIEDENANTFGYLFITFNSLLGIYIFVFHCIQNEKIRREYRKYIRQNSWLPKCLRCSKTSSISSSTVTGTHHHHGQAPSQNYGTSASKKSPVIAATGGAADVYGDADVIGAGVGGCGSNLTANAVIDPSSDNIIVRAGKSSILPYQQQQTSNSSMGSISRIAGLTGTIQRHNLVLERSTGGTLRSTNASGVGVIGGHVSPTSSAGSTHLIFNSMKNDSSQDWSFQQPSQMPGQFMQPGQASAIQQLTANEKNLNTSFDDSKFLYYDCKSKRLKQHPSNSRASSSSSSSIQQQQQMTPQQQHEYFYWTEKNNKKKINGDVKTHKSDTVHTFYPSYKKTMMKHFTSSSQADDEKLSDCDFTDIDSEQQQRRYYRYPSSSSSATFKHHLQQQQLSSDDDHAAESHLIHHGQHPSDCFGPMDVTSTPYHHPHPGYHRGYQQAPHQQYHHGRHKQHSNSCDLSSMTMPPPPPSQSPGGGVPIGAYYNQNNCIGPEEPVYEEILNSRMSSEICDDDDDDDDDDNAAVDNDDEDDVNMIMKEERYNRLRRMIANKEDVIRQPFSRQLVNKKSPILSDDDFQHHRLQQKQLSHPHQQQNQQQQVVSRNLSAMLDENNMVVCYLEPLPK